MRRSAIPAFQTFVGASLSGRPSTEERHRYARLPLTLPGRYMLVDGREFPCQTQDISPIGIGIRGFPAGAIGDRVVAYFDGLGRVEGRIVRRSETWFAVDITATPRKLEKLANKIDCLVERESRGAYCAQGAIDAPSLLRITTTRPTPSNSEPIDAKRIARCQ